MFSKILVILTFSAVLVTSNPYKSEYSVTSKGNHSRATPSVTTSPSRENSSITLTPSTIFTMTDSLKQDELVFLAESHHSQQSPQVEPETLSMPSVEIFSKTANPPTKISINSRTSSRENATNNPTTFRGNTSITPDASLEVSSSNLQSSKTLRGNTSINPTPSTEKTIVNSTPSRENTSINLTYPADNSTTTPRSNYSITPDPFREVSSIKPLSSKEISTVTPSINPTSSTEKSTNNPTTSKGNYSFTLNLSPAVPSISPQSSKELSTVTPSINSTSSTDNSTTTPRRNYSITSNLSQEVSSIKSQSSTENSIVSSKKSRKTHSVTILNDSSLGDFVGTVHTWLLLRSPTKAPTYFSFSHAKGATWKVYFKLKFKNIEV